MTTVVALLLVTAWFAQPSAPAVRVIRVAVEDWSASAAQCQAQYGTVKIVNEQGLTLGIGQMRPANHPHGPCNLQAFIPVRKAFKYSAVFPGLTSVSGDPALGPFGQRWMDRHHSVIYFMRNT